MTIEGGLWIIKRDLKDMKFSTFFDQEKLYSRKLVGFCLEGFGSSSFIWILPPDYFSFFKKEIVS